MQIYHGLPDDPFSKPIYLTIGNFDGVHLGHQRLIRELARAAHQGDGLAGLLTFEPHPVAVLRSDLVVPRLTSSEDRADILAALGLDFVIVFPFTRSTAETSAADFLAALMRVLPLAELWVGPDFALGRGREGNIERLTGFGRHMGFSLQVIPNLDWQGEPVRSSRVRSLLAEDGAVAQAAELLGRPYRLAAEVVRGAQRGTGLGFPTANLLIPEDRLTPAYGVYACWAWRGERGYPAVVNVGVRPSFDNGHPSVEAHLIDFAGDLYGEVLGLSFIARLRGEKRFAEIADLVAQIGTDTASAKQLLSYPDTHAQAAAAASWREIAHTADYSVEVSGADLRTLFANSALAMYGYQDVEHDHPVSLARAIAVQADGFEELMVGWLNRLLLWQETGGEMYTRFEIHELSECGLRGVAYGYPGSPSHTAIKAATFYDLLVQETVAGWRARVTFDI